MNTDGKYSVLHVCKVFLPVRGGVQIVVSRIRDAVCERFKHSVLATTKASIGESNSCDESVTFVRSYGDIFSMPIAPQLITQIWRSARKHDLLVVHYPFPIVDLAISLAFFIKLPPILVYWHSEIVSQRFSGRLVRPFTRLMLRRASRIIVSSPNLIEHSSILKNYRSKCKVVPFGYNPGRKECNLPAQDYFLFIGRHVPYKGIDVLIKAVAKSRVKIRVVGDGPLLRQHLELVQTLSLGDHIEFLENESDDEVERLLSECKALVLPSVLPSEAFALVQIEAMSFGKPVINTNIRSGVPWVARNDQEGITVEPGDVDSLADALTALWTNKELCDRLGHAARLRWRKVFSIEEFASATGEVYLETVKSA